jgi:hypothetical protein
MDFFGEDQVADVVGALLQAHKNAPPGDGSLELEFRLGQIRGRFEPSLNPNLFKNVIAGLRTNPRWAKVTESHTVDYSTPNGLRVTRDVIQGSWTGMRKTKIFTKTLKSAPESALDVRVSAALETPCPTPPGPPPDGILVREKHRTSFFHRFWRYDLTEVTTHADRGPRKDLDEDRKVTYEIELELVDPGEIVGKPDDYIAYVVRFGLMLCCDMIKLSGPKE